MMINDYNGDPVCKRIYERAIKDLDGTKYLYFNMLIGCVSHVFRQARVPVINPIPETYLDVFLDALYDSFYGGCEPEWETEEEYNKFQESIRRLKEDLVWSTPKYSPQLNKFLFPNGCERVPSICTVQEVAERIEQLHKNKDNTSTWHRGDLSPKELYEEFYGYNK